MDSGHSQNRNVEFTDADELTAFAQAYYATEYPNSERVGCPPRGALSQFALSSKLPDADMRAHLFTCSECFRSYRSVRMGIEAQAAGQGNWRLNLLQVFAAPMSRYVMAGTAGACLILFGIITFIIWRAQRETTPIALNNPPIPSAADPTRSQPVREEGSKEAPPSIPGNKISSNKLLSAGTPKRSGAARSAPEAPSIIVDLEELPVLRGAGAGDKRTQAIHLLPERQQLTLRLPKGTPEGRYSVSVVDTFGKARSTSIARLRGRTIKTYLNLRGLMGSGYRLAVAPLGEAPDYHPITIRR